MIFMIDFAIKVITVAFTSGISSDEGCIVFSSSVVEETKATRTDVQIKLSCLLPRVSIGFTGRIRHVYGCSRL